MNSLEDLSQEQTDLLENKKSEIEGPDAKKENIVTDQTEAQLLDQTISSADGILTPADSLKSNPLPEAEDSEIIQGEISQEEAIAAIKQNRQLRREVATLKERLS